MPTTPSPEISSNINGTINTRNLYNNHRSGDATLLRIRPNVRRNQLVSDKSNSSANKNSNWIGNALSASSLPAYSLNLPGVSFTCSAALFLYDIRELSRIRENIKSLNNNLNDLSCDKVFTEANNRLGKLIEKPKNNDNLNDNDLNMNLLIECKKNLESKLEKLTKMGLNSDKNIEAYNKRQYDLDKLNLLLCSMKIKDCNVQMLNSTLVNLPMDSLYLGSDAAILSGIPLASMVLYGAAKGITAVSSVINYLLTSSKDIKKLEKEMLKFDKFKIPTAKEITLDSATEMYVNRLVKYFEKHVLDEKTPVKKTESAQQFNKFLKSIDVDVENFYELSSNKSSDKQCFNLSTVMEVITGTLYAQKLEPETELFLDDMVDYFEKNVMPYKSLGEKTNKEQDFNKVLQSFGVNIDKFYEFCTYYSSSEVKFDLFLVRTSIKNALNKQKCDPLTEKYIDMMTGFFERNVKNAKCSGIATNDEFHFNKVLESMDMDVMKFYSLSTVVSSNGLEFNINTMKAMLRSAFNTISR